MRNTTTTFTLVVACIVATAGGGQAADDPSLVGWWNFDDGPSGTALDSSGNGNHGTLQGGITWVTTETGWAVELDGSTGNITIPFSDSLGVLNTGDFTLTAWFKPDAIPTANQIVFQQGDLDGIGRTWLFVHSTNEIRTFLGGSPTLSLIPVEGGTWYHAAVVVTEQGATDSIQMFVNGRAEAAPGELGMEDSQGEFFIGSHKNGSNFWDGQLDDIRIYNRALEPEEIAAMVPPKLKARDPETVDGDVTVVIPLLRWTPGDTALLHDVYLGTDPNLGADDLVQSRSPATLYYHALGVTPGTTYYWRVDEIEGDMTTVHAGDVWTFIAQPLAAYIPEPADGENEVSTDPNITLNWMAGQGATAHHLYFSEVQADVANGTANADKGSQAETVFAPGALAPLTTYYWRVDESAVDGSVETGSAWVFSTFAIVDDFESYTEDIDAGEAIFLTWIDGVENGSTSYVGYEFSANGTFGETTIVHSGGQSMPLDYNNVNAPYYAETSRTWPTAQNWTAGGADTLVLYVQGNWSNGPEPLYIAIEDTGSHTGMVVHPSPAAAATPGWTPWRIPLSEFNEKGVNVAAVKTMHIGLGDPAAPTPGGAGLIFIDDIRLTKPSALE